MVTVCLWALVRVSAQVPVLVPVKILIFVPVPVSVSVKTKILVPVPVLVSVKSLVLSYSGENKNKIVDRLNLIFLENITFIKTRFMDIFLNITHTDCPNTILY